MSDKRVFLTKHSPAYWRVTLNHPPVNIFGPKTIPQLNEVITAIETDKELKVVVFDSAIDGFFMTHYDFVAKVEDTTSLPPGPTGLQPLPDMLVRLSRAPVVSIASIRGRATGVGSELALACDMRFASREKAILSHFEVGAGIVPGGGPMARLPRLMGRGRALEVLLGADDIPGDLAERYGYVNRSLPDADLDEFVDALATRIASFDKQAISETKRFVDVASLPPDYEIAPEWDVCLASIMRPAAQKRIKQLMEQGFHKPGDVENGLVTTSDNSVVKRHKKGEYQMSHHASGPNFGFPRGDARLDMTDLYAFAKPGDPSRSIIVLNVHPSFRLDSPEPTTIEPFKPGALYEFKIDTNGDAVADICYSVQFASSADGKQTATVRRLQGARAAGVGEEGEVIVQQAPVSVGREALVTKAGDYRFFFGWRSDPFFFDAKGNFNHMQFTGDDFFNDKNVCSIVH